MDYTLANNYKSKDIWGMFTHALTPLIKINQFCYLINKNSQIFKIVPKYIKAIRYRDLIKKLKKIANIEFIRNSAGSHEIWSSKDGNKTVIPKHISDIPVGTIKSILKDLGINMSFEEFLRA